MSFSEYKSRAGAGGDLPAGMGLSGPGGEQKWGSLQCSLVLRRGKRKMPVFWFEEYIPFTWVAHLSGKSSSSPEFQLRTNHGACTGRHRLHALWLGSTVKAKEE